MIRRRQPEQGAVLSQCPIRHRSGLIIGLLAAITFGIYPSAAKLAYADGATVAFVIVATTFARALALALFCLWKRLPLLPPPGDWHWAVSGGFFQALSIIGIIGSLAYIPGPVTIIIVFSHTIMLLFFLAYRGEIELRRSTVASTLGALFGLTFVVDVWHNLHGLNYRGLGLAFVAALATLSRLYVFGKQVLRHDPAVVGARVFAGAFICTLALIPVLPVQPPASAVGYFWTAVSCLSLVLGTFGTFYGIAWLGAFQFSLLIKLEPVFTALFAIVLIREYLSIIQYFGILVVLCSLLAYQISAARTVPTISTAAD